MDGGLPRIDFDGPHPHLSRSFHSASLIIDLSFLTHIMQRVPDGVGGGRTFREQAEGILPPSCRNRGNWGGLEKRRAETVVPPVLPSRRNRAMSAKKGRS